MFSRERLGSFQLDHHPVINPKIRIVLTKLGPGFLEKVYENAMRIELEKLGLRVEQQEPIRIEYEGFQNEPIGAQPSRLLVAVVAISGASGDACAPVEVPTTGWQPVVLIGLVTAIPL